MFGRKNYSQEEVDRCKAAVRLTAEEFERLAAAFFAEVERKFR